MGRSITGPPQPGNVVEELYIGSTRIRFCDDYCRDKTSEDVQRILERIEKRFAPVYFAALEERAKAVA